MLFHPNSEQNKFGFYRVGPTFCTYSLFEALEHRRQTNHPIKWDYNDDFFRSLDWTQEPKENLLDLYAQRCRQLREKYDYLVLWYSGGSDSHNILNCFVDYGVHLDEILIFHSERLTGAEKTSRVDTIGEIFLAAIPEAQRSLANYPHTKIRVVDISDLIEDAMRDLATTNLKFDFLYFGNSYNSPLSLGYKRLPYQPYYQELYQQGKKVCFISGIDKPFVEFVDRRWQLKFFSRVDSMFDIARQVEKHPCIFDELFYWAPEAWPILVKQAHEIRRFFLENPEFIKKTVKESIDFVPAVDDKFTSASSLNFFGKTVPMWLIKKIIYPYWRNDIVDFGKMMCSTLPGGRNDWYKFRPPSMTVGGQEHRTGIEKYIDLLDHKGDIYTCHNHVFYTDPYYF